MLEAVIPLYALMVGILLIGEVKRASLIQRAFKPLAALTFVLMAVMSGAVDSLYGKLILGGLIACAAGDVALLSRERPAIFKLGMAAFAIGHILFAAAFWQVKYEINWLWALPLLIGGGLNWMYLRAHLPADMKVPVLIYTLIILAMVLLSIWTGNLLVIAAAVMFAVSDIFVARDRFVSESPRNALIITPFYFGAQAIFALSIALI